MPKSDAVYLGHMLDAAQKAARKAAGKTRLQFDADDEKGDRHPPKNANYGD